MIHLKMMSPRAVLSIPKFSPNQFRTYMGENNMTLDRPERMKAFRDLTNRVNNNEECWAWQIQNLTFMIGLEGRPEAAI